MSAASEFAGRIGERVTLSRPVADRDALGGWTGGWRATDTVWAEVEPEAKPLFWRVTLRPAALFVGDRIDWGAETLRVRSVRIDPEAPDRMVAIAEQEP